MSNLFLSVVYAVLLMSLSGFVDLAQAAVKCGDRIGSSGNIYYSSALTKFTYHNGKTYALALSAVTGATSLPDAYFAFDAGVTRDYFYDGTDTNSLKLHLAAGRYGAARPVTIPDVATKQWLLGKFGSFISGGTYIDAWKGFGTGLPFTKIDGSNLPYTDWSTPPDLAQNPSGVVMQKDGHFVTATSGVKTQQLVEFDGKLDCALDTDIVIPPWTGGGGETTPTGPGPGATENSNDPYAIKDVICGQDLNLNDFVGDPGEMLNCLNSPQGQLCTVGALDCNTTHQDPSCPSGSSLNTTRDMCQADPTIKCPSGYTWDSTIDRCVSAPVCPGGTFNATTQRCEKLVQNDCPSGYSYDSAHDLCYVAVSCSGGGVYVAARDRCELAMIPSCAGGFSYDSAKALCYAAPQCPNGGSYNTTYNKCMQAYSPSCPGGYSWVAGRGRCEYQPPTCPGGTGYNTSTNRCESIPTCGSGTYSSNANNCVSGGSYAARLVGSIYYNVAIGLDDSWMATFGNMMILKGYISSSPFSGSVAIGLNGDNAVTFGDYNIVGYISSSPFSGSVAIGLNDNWLTDFSGIAQLKGYISSSPGTFGGSYTCPSGGTLSGTTCNTTSSSTAICPAGTSLDSAADRCVVNPTCIGGNFDGTYDVCWASMTPSCGSGWIYDSSVGQCTQSAYCANSATLNGTTDRCEQAFAPSCSSSYTYDSGNALCYSGPLCANGTFVTATDRCEATVTKNCAAYSWNAAEQKCIVAASCGQDASYPLNSTITFSFSLNECVSDTQHTCVAGTTYNGLPVEKCEAVPICPGAIYYDWVSHSCLVSTGCPYGPQVACLQNPHNINANGQGGWQCSPNACVNTGPGGAASVDEIQDDAYLQDDGPREDGKCLGQIYIFNGKKSRCRPTGWTVGYINDCCADGKVMTEDTGGAGTVVGLAFKSMQVIYEASKAAYYAYQGAQAIAAGYNVTQVGLGAAASMTPAAAEATVVGATAASQGANTGQAVAAGIQGSTAVASVAKGAAAAAVVWAAGAISDAAGGDQDSKMVAQMLAALIAMQVGLLSGPQAIVGVIIIVVMRLVMGTGCDQNDITTVNFNASKRCHFVGDYCEKKWALVGCVQKAKGYCCFNSVMARIIHEQGRPQINFEWGNPANPECRGFKPEEFQSLDFGKIDLSEYFEIVQKDMETKIGDMQQGITDKMTERFQQITGGAVAH